MAIKQTRELSRLITLAESNKLEDRVKALKLSTSYDNTLRIGISGPPGAGKSTFIDAIGKYIIEDGHKVAVLSIDPSSPISGGSILGDKTRMPYLSSSEMAFVRPSPSSLTLGGVTSTTPDVINLCETFGYDVVIVETVGVGQSEISIRNMVDIFVLLLPPASGDELQGIKKGIVEIADIILVNKYDGATKDLASITASDYMEATSCSGQAEKSVLKVSALENYGIEEVWEHLLEIKNIRKHSGEWDKLRTTQLKAQFQEALMFEVYEHVKSNFSSSIDQEEIAPSPHLKAIEAVRRILGEAR